MTRTLATLALLLISCGEPVDGEVGERVVMLDARSQLIRLSVDLRSVHPSGDELDAIELKPELYGAFVDRYLDDPRFLDRIEEIYNQTIRTRTGETYFEVTEAGLSADAEDRIASAIADEPLKLVRHIVENDLPFTELVLADYTMADPIVATMWNIEYPEGAEGWQQAHYTDGREHAGILSSTTMWLRYPSAGVNANRHRANTVSRILLCDDYLARPVSFSRTQIDALTSGDPEDVIRQTPTCQSCHSSMDPIASHFFGYWWEREGGLDDQTTYRPEDEFTWREPEMSGKSTGYFGVPTSGMGAMAELIAEDPRFVDCAVQTVFEGLTQRTVVEEDWTELQSHREAFSESGLILRDLVKSIVMSEEYRAVEAVETELGERLPTVKMASTTQLSGIISGKTGHVWEFDGRDGLRFNDDGLVVLGGGIDSQYVTTPSHDPSVGMVFIQERYAQSAAWQVASHDLDPNREGEAVLLSFVTIEDTPESNRAAFATQIEALYLDITGHKLASQDDEEPEEVEQLIELWRQLYSVEASSQLAWSGVVSVVLRDPQVLFY
ncbi:MAG: DUF1588 domain-containing protein [Proteobacteria bacterium]|nr:DUF1588 domain-containing protein [Pseudomonadota bacterium]